MQKARKRANKVCKQCATEFNVPYYRHNTAKYCSRRCTSLGSIAAREHKRLLAIKGKKAHNNKQINKACAQCGLSFLISPSRIDYTKYCSKDCYSKSQLSTLPVTRYKRVTIDGRRLPEHRYVMEQFLGRNLKTTEHVHHKNFNKHDNNLSNLEVLDIVAHAKLHAELKKHGKKKSHKGK